MIHTSKRSPTLLVAMTRRTRPLVCASLLSMASMSGLAGPADQELQVRATVARHASLQVLAQPASLTLTPDDIARGYVELPAACEVAVQNNSPGGYLVVLSSESPFVQSTLLRGLGADVQWGPAGGTLAQPAAGRGMSRQTLALSYRFVLSPEAHPGSYAWPVRLAVTPL